MIPSLPIEIPLSKKKLTLLLILSIAFIMVGLWLAVQPPEIDNPIFGNPILFFTIGIGTILFFGLCAILISRKLSDDTPGLIINDQGVYDNSSGVSAGIVLWSDIREIKIRKVATEKFIMIIVKNPEEYINRQTSLFKRKTMQLNYESFGSPVSISTKGLKINFDELYQMIQDKYREHVLMVE